ncbi:peptide chain release factor N(5)-glutamine methyltransferase [Agromyces atrinae]|uniref:Release factor glutamine methyltransferase n=1 Tax=Agromyces atrinae TaxID=592376 RepID=A0A4Q2M6U0_9MICO|nr:release factor glutamine methyltransferase [Agromyces atrinae]RXZ85532.1 peptide chain release factor N(5)-glutamine methyltransferase [Agromyces atrinae]
MTPEPRDASDTDLRGARATVIRRLTDAGVPDAEVDADLLLGHVLGLSRGGLHARLVVGGSLSDDDLSALAPLVERRVNREPLQHITGRAPFRALDLHVGPGVFIPRPETEQVVQIAIDALHAVADPAPVAVDLGSGSGAIALALATEVPHARVFAVEKSPDALPWTRRNIAEFGGESLTLVEGDLADALGDLDGSVAVVISNPPYVPRTMMPVDPEVHLFDPEMALYGGEDGLDVIRILSGRARRLLRSGGLLVIEHAEHQSGEIAAILAADSWRGVSHHRDFTMRDRATTAVR